MYSCYMYLRVDTIVSVSYRCGYCLGCGFYLNYHSLAKESPMVHLTLGSDKGMGGYSRYPYCVLPS